MSHRGGRGGRGGNSNSKNRAPFSPNSDRSNSENAASAHGTPRRGGRGGSVASGHFTPNRYQQQQGSPAGYGTPPHPHNSSSFRTPPASHRAAGSGYKPYGRDGYNPHGSGSGRAYPSSPFYSPSPAPVPAIEFGEFSVDVRQFKAAINISAKLGGQELEDGHMEEKVIPWLNQRLDSYIRQEYAGVKRSLIQVNIELQDNYLTGVGVCTLVRHLMIEMSSGRLPYRLTALKFWNNQIGDDACGALSQLLILAARCDEPLAELHLSHNAVTEKGAAQLLCAVHEYMRADCTLTRIDTHASDTIQPVAPTRPSQSSTVSCTSRSSLDHDLPLSPTCTVTDYPISQPAHPLWLRLEWNAITHTYFDRNFEWMTKMKPKKMKAEARKIREAWAARQEQQHEGSSSLSLDHDENDDNDKSEEGMDADVDDKQEDQNSVAAHNEQFADEDITRQMEGLSLAPSTASPSTSLTTTTASLPFPLPPPSLRICSASNRDLCSVRMCQYPQGLASVHVCFFHLQHQNYEKSDLLDILKAQRKKRKKALEKMEKRAEKIHTQMAEQPEPTVTPHAAEPVPPADRDDHDNHVDARATPSSPTSSPLGTVSLSTSTPAPRPLVLFLDTNATFNMISSRGLVSKFHWDRLYQLAKQIKFGSGFDEEERRAYIVLCAAVLHEMDARKEYHRAHENGLHGKERHQHFTSLARAIKQQFQLNVADQSQGFLAKCKNLGGLGQGFLKTLSIAQGEMNCHPSMRPSQSDARNTSNDRRILNAALHWAQTINETGVVLLVTDDRNLQNLAQAEGVPVVSLFSLDRALSSPSLSNSPLDSVTLRSAIASCSQDLAHSLVSEAKLAPRMDRNVYECLESAIQLVSRALAHPNRQMVEDEEEVEEMLACWKGVVVNAPDLLTSIRNNRTNTITSVSASAAASSSPSQPSTAPVD